jgi:hypothetical protein
MSTFPKSVKALHRGPQADQASVRAAPDGIKAFCPRKIVDGHAKKKSTPGHPVKNRPYLRSFLALHRSSPGWQPSKRVSNAAFYS